jgi:drug/metabolite transporter (DMT)-like permease
LATIADSKASAIPAAGRQTRADHRKPLNVRAAGFALLLSTLWAGNPVASKAGLEDAGPLRLGWMRFALGGAVVLVWSLATRQDLRVRGHEVRPMVLLGILFCVQLAFMNIGQDHTSAGHAVIVGTTFPLWSAVFAHFFVPGDRMSRGRAFGAVIAYSGVVAVFSRSLSAGGDFLLGDSLLLVSAVLLGARQVYISQAAQGIAQHKLLLSQFAFGIVTFVAASLVFESGDPWEMTARLAVALLYTGVLIAGFGFIGQTWLLKNYLPSRVTIISLSQPVFGVLFSWWVLGESVGPELYVGAALVMLGSWLAQRGR